MARIAEGQQGVVARPQLLDAGLSAEQIRQLLLRGALLVEFRGVYRVGHRAPSVEARYMAAVLACGENALLSGRAAGHLLGLLKGPAPTPDVTAPKQRRIEGITTYRTRTAHSLDATTWHGIPTTTVPRTLTDLAATLSLDDLARACHEAGVRFQTTPAQVEQVLARRPSTPGASNLRLVSLPREHGRPLPQTTRPAGGRRVDCRWPDHHLTVELDSYRYHGSRHAWEHDRRREREAYARGDEFRRYTYGDVYEDSGLMLAELRDLIGGLRSAAAPNVPVEG